MRPHTESSGPLPVDDAIPGPERCEDPKDRRRFGRLRSADLRTSMGRVLDLSGGGMRIESRWPMRVKAGDRVLISLVSEGGEVDVQVCVSWVKNLGLFRQQAGLEFIELSPRTRALLLYLSRTGLADVEPATGWSAKEPI